MRALSIRQPWAWLILHAGKDIENRDWPAKRGGPFLIHASKGMTKDEYCSGDELLRAINRRTGGVVVLPPFEALERGGIVGSVELVDCVEDSLSPWFTGRYGFVLRNPVPCEFKPLKGMLGFFEAHP